VTTARRPAPAATSVRVEATSNAGLAPHLINARAARRRVVVVSEAAAGVEWQRLLTDSGAEVQTAPADVSALARLLRDPTGKDPRSLLLLDGVDVLGGWAFLERAEARIVRLLDTLAAHGAPNVEIIVRDVALATRLEQLPSGADPAVDRLRTRIGLTAPPREASRARRALWRVAAALVMCAAVVSLVAGVFVGPNSADTLVIGGVDTRVPGALWLDSWVADALLRGDFAALVRTDALWWPFGADLAALFGNLAPALLAAPFVHVFGYPGFWNVFVAAALVTNGMAAAALARTAGAHRIASLLAGIGFAVAPPLLVAAEEGRQAQLLAFALPLALRAGLRALDGHRRSDALLAACWTMAAGYIWWWYGGIALTLLGLAWLDRAVRDAPARAVLWDNLRHGAYVVAPAALAAIPLVVAFHGGQVASVDAGLSVLDTAGDPGTDARIKEIAQGSLSPEQLLFGGGPLPEWGVQLALVSLALLTCVFLPRGRRPGWLLLAMSFAAVSLGPWILVDEVAYSGPWDLLYRWMPFFSRSGVPAWMLAPGALCLAVWLALALSDLSPSADRGVRPLAPVGILALAVALALGLPAANGRLPLARFAFDPPSWWSLLGDEGAVVVIPLAGNDMPLAWQRLHHRAIATGPSAGIAIEAAGPVHSGLDKAPLLRFLSRPGEQPFARQALDEAWDQGLRWIIVDQERLSGLLATGMVGGGWGELGEHIERNFGPPRFANPAVRIYALRDAMDDDEALSSAFDAPGGSPPGPPQ
jgi:hypothetical protein